MIPPSDKPKKVVIQEPKEEEVKIETETHGIFFYLKEEFVEVEKKQEEQKSIYEMDPIEYDCYKIKQSMFKRHDEELQEYLDHYNMTQRLPQDIYFLLTPRQISQLNNISSHHHQFHHTRQGVKSLKKEYLKVPSPLTASSYILVYGTSILMNEVWTLVVTTNKVGPLKNNDSTHDVS